MGEVVENNEVVENKKKLTKKDLNKCWWIWELTSEMCLSYERLMSLGFCHAMVPIMKKLYGDDKEELSKGLTRHMSFFNTENQFGALIPGMAASIEEERANGAPYSDEMIDSLKVGLMGPLAGIGDTRYTGPGKDHPAGYLRRHGSEGQHRCSAYLLCTVYGIYSGYGTLHVQHRIPSGKKLHFLL